MRPRYFQDFFARLREGDVEDLFAGLRAREEKLQGQGGLARAGLALDEIQPAGHETAPENVVQTGNTSRNAVALAVALFVHRAEDTRGLFEGTIILRGRRRLSLTRPCYFAGCRPASKSTSSFPISG